MKQAEDTPDTFTRTELLRMRDYPADVIAGTNRNGHVEAAESTDLEELCSICGTRPRHLSWSTCDERECRTEAKRARDRLYAKRRRIAAASSPPRRAQPAPPVILSAPDPSPSAVMAPMDGLGVSNPAIMLAAWATHLQNLDRAGVRVVGLTIAVGDDTWTIGRHPSSIDTRSSP